MALTWDMCPPVAVALGLGVGCLVASVTIFTCRFMNRFRDDDDSAVPFDDDVLDKDEEDDRDVPGVAEDDEVNAATSPDRPSKNLRSKAGSKKTTRKTGTTKRKASKSAPKRRRGKSLGAEAVEDEEEENDGEQQDYVREEDGEASYASTAAATTASGLTRATVTFSGVDDYSPAPTTRMTSPAAAYSSMIPDVPTMTTTGKYDK
ncbi:unnamed protein product [Symbiodinium sp. KB8]|nr:unnamed protein product [Symbiodinium sp. KB8]